MACQLRLFGMDHYFPYGPWPLDFGSWSEFEEETMKEVQGTAALGVTLRHQCHAVDVKFNADKWNMRAVRAGDKIVISHSHPSLDSIFDPTVTQVRGGIITLGWKSNWKRLEERLPEQRSKCPFSPADLFRADIHIEDISPGRVRSVLDKLTCMYGEERHDVAFITPLQAMITLQVQINNASADRLRHGKGFRDGAFVADDHTLRPDRQDGAFVAGHGGSNDGAFVAQERGRSTDPRGAFDALPEEQQPFSLKSVASERDCSSPAEEYQECWVRPLRHIVPPAQEHLTEAAVASRLNRTQTRALLLTRKHRLVLVRGRPGTGKTQLAAAAIHAWTKTVPSDSTIIVAGPSNAATNNLLDRIARDKDDHVRLGRLGDDPSVFEPSRAKFSLSHEENWGGEFGDVKRHVLNR